MVLGLGSGTGDVLAADASDRCGTSCVLSHSPCTSPPPPVLATALPVAAAIPAWFRVQGVGFRVQGVWFRVWDLRLG